MSCKILKMIIIELYGETDIRNDLLSFELIHYFYLLKFIVYYA